MLMIDIHKVLNELQKTRKYFHNEKDFQFYFSWCAKLLYPKINIRLEYHFNEMEDNKKSYIDLVLFDENEAWIFEFKFKTIKSEFFDDKTNEYYIYKEQGAQDLGVYSIHADLSRIEKSVLNHKMIFGKEIKKGYCIFLTNDKRYLNGFTKKSCFYNYGLNKGTINKGVIKFNIPNSKTKEEMFIKNYKEICYLKDHNIKWDKYSIYDMMIIEVSN